MAEHSKVLSVPIQVPDRHHWHLSALAVPQICDGLCYSDPAPRILPPGATPDVSPVITTKQFLVEPLFWAALCSTASFRDV